MVGRGANKQPLSAVAATRDEVFHFDPPMYHPPTSRHTFDVPRLNMPFYKPPPPPPMMPTIIPPDPQEEKLPSQTEDRLAMPIEGRAEYKEAVASLNLSERVHVIGTTLEARFITHCLAGIPGFPPPQMLTGYQAMATAWGAAGKMLSLRDATGLAIKNHVQMPQYVGPQKTAGRLGSLRTRLRHMDNLILCGAAASIIPTLRTLRDSINQDTVVCLLQPGLGLVEHINEILFPDPQTRPTYVLGHSTHQILKDSKDPANPYSMKMKKEGVLLLSGIRLSTSEDGTDTYVQNDRMARFVRTQHFIKLLSQAPGLNASSRPFAKFLRAKLPEMITSSLSDSLSVALGFRYERLLTDPHASRLWSRLFLETIQVVAALPELKDHPNIVNYFTGRNFVTEVRRFMISQKGTSKWFAMLRRGQSLPVYSLNGYFIRRARELGMDAPNHQHLLDMVRAKENARREELRAEIPLYHSPYDSVLDHDEDDSKPSVRVVYTNK